MGTQRYFQACEPSVRPRRPPIEPAMEESIDMKHVEAMYVAIVE